MSSISSSVANAAAYTPPAPNVFKQDATKTDTAKTGSSTTGLQKPVESKAYRNSDGTYGPKHTILPPANVAQTASQKEEANETASDKAKESGLSVNLTA